MNLMTVAGRGQTTKLQRIALAAACSIAFLSANAMPVAAAAAAGKSNKSASQNSQSSQSSVGAVATGNGSVQNYAADSTLQVGTIVQLAKNSTTKVEPASGAAVQQMYGVTVDPHQLSLTVTNSSLTDEVFVATSGTYDVLVSNQTGTIKNGDYITMSAIDGVGMNAASTDTLVFGRAVGGFDGKSGVIGSTQLKDKAGQVVKNVSFGLIPVAIGIERNPDEKSTKANLPKSLQRIGQAIAEKPVGGARLYLSVAVVGVTVIIAVVMLYAGIRSSLIAIGRNPLSKKTIFRGLLEIILTSILVVIVGLFGVYLLLKL